MDLKWALEGIESMYETYAYSLKLNQNSQNKKTLPLLAGSAISKALT